MTQREKNIAFVMLFLALVTSVSLILMEQGNETQLEASGGFERVIWTDKEEYELGETVKAAILFVNNGDQQLEIAPIYSFTFSGNSVYDPMPVAGGVFMEYVEPKIIIPADGNITFIESSWTPTYPGPFKIAGLSLTKTVNVTGYKEVTLNSTGISLDVITNQTSIKSGDIVDFYLIIRNENPYPVKVPVYEKFARSGVPIERQTDGIMIEWVTSHFKVEANSYRITWQDRRTVRAPGFSLFYMVDGCRASIELEVEN